MANEFKIKNGLIVDQGGVQITGSLLVSGSFNLGDDITIDGNISGSGNAYIAGNVGIGTTTPIAKLNIFGTDQLIQIGDTTSVNDAYISLNNRGFIGFDASQGMLWQATTSRPFNIAHGSDWGTSLQSRLYIKTSGEVGIGTTTPTAKLHVSGTVQFDDILSITPQDPLPSGVPTGSFAVSSSSPPKPYFYDGTNWNALY